MKVLVTILLTSGVCFALPEVNDLTLREQRLVLELSDTNIPKSVEIELKRKEALKADLNGDGRLDMVDLAVFADCWAAWHYKEPVVELPVKQTVKEPIPFYGDPNNLEQMNYYLNYLMEIEQ